MNPTTPVDTSEERDRRLVELLGALTEDLRSGREPDLEASARLHPDLAGELRELWAAASIADELARSSSSSDETGEWPMSSLSLSGREPAVRLFGKYELLEEVGRGGMGVVHRALDLGTGKIVAVKRLLRGRTSSPEDAQTERFLAEARIVARLTHPVIIDVDDSGSIDGQLYLVMRFVKGTTLARKLVDGPLTAREAARLLIPICEGIAHAHQQGVLHRDLKPSNILIDEQGRPFVCDFGLAKRIDLPDDSGLTPTGAVLGTPSYMAPEQAASRWGEISKATDVYGLGAILYQMLTGRPPFQGASPLDTILLVLEQDPVPPRVLNPRVAPELEMVALKCLQKDPSLRYGSANDLARDLSSYLKGDSLARPSLRALAGRFLGETQHTALLENWGQLWMYHGVALVVFYGLTYRLLARGVTDRWPFFAIFTVGLGLWAALFWKLRQRRGPVTFVERQLAHVWAAGIAGVNLLLVAEWLLGLPVMALAPLLAITNGMLFLVKAGFLSGEFYLCSALVFLSLVPAALYPKIAIPLLAMTFAGCFFATGLKYHLRHLRTRRLIERSS
jgi:eukaryotic-like serine/threonine-protein kinase